MNEFSFGLQLAGIHDLSEEVANRIYGICQKEELDGLLSSTDTTVTLWIDFEAHSCWEAIRACIAKLEMNDLDVEHVKFSMTDEEFLDKKQMLLGLLGSLVNPNNWHERNCGKGWFSKRAIDEYAAWIAGGCKEYTGPCDLD